MWLVRAIAHLWRAVGVYRAHSLAYPFATNLSLISIPIGLLAVMVGPPISTAFDRVYHRPELIYVWGAVLLVGGLNVAFGIHQQLPSVERAGLYVLAFPWIFYGISVIIGLRLGGLVAGPLALTIGLSCWQRARYILTEAKYLAEHPPPDPGP